MESFPGGGSLASHLEATRRAVTDWLEYENPPENEVGQDDYLLRLALDNEQNTTPDMPEILQLLRESRALGIPIYNGSLMDLPYVFHLELTTCIAAENEFAQIQTANQRAWEKWKHATLSEQSSAE